jgi:acetyl esterase
MPLDEQVEEFLKQMNSAKNKPYSQMSVEQARRQMVVATTLLGSAPNMHQTEEISIDVDGGKIALRIYHPADVQDLPVLVYFHGGGWVLGGIDTHDGYCRALAAGAAIKVVSVDYRLAPECKFPLAAEDCYAATQWVVENAASFGGDPQRIAVGGDSAGGNLATVVALMARDRGGPELAFQLLNYPITNFDLETPSYNENAEGFGLTKDTMAWFWDHYLSSPEDAVNPYASPMKAESLAGMPPALVVTAEYDPLRDEGEAYAQRLNKEGGATELVRFEGVIHGFTRRYRIWPQAGEAIELAVLRLQQHLGI